MSLPGLLAEQISSDVEPLRNMARANINESNSSPLSIHGNSSLFILFLGFLLELSVGILGYVFFYEPVLVVLSIPYLLFTPSIYLMAFQPISEFSKGNRPLRIASIVILSILVNAILAYILVSVQIFALGPFWRLRFTLLILVATYQATRSLISTGGFATPRIRVDFHSVSSLIAKHLSDIILLGAVLSIDIGLISFIGTDLLVEANQLQLYFTNPAVIALHLVPIAMSVKAFYRDGRKHFSLLLLFIHAAALRAAPSFILGYVWSSDQLLHRHFTDLLLQGTTPYQLFQGSTIPAYPLFLWHLFSANFILISGFDVLLFIGPIVIFFLAFVGVSEIGNIVFRRSSGAKYLLLAAFSLAYPVVEFHAYTRPFELICAILPFFFLLSSLQTCRSVRISWFCIFSVLVLGAHIMGTILVQMFIFYEIYRILSKRFGATRGFMTLAFGEIAFLLPAFPAVVASGFGRINYASASNIFELFFLRILYELGRQSDRFNQIVHPENYSSIEYVNLLYLQILFVAGSIFLFALLSARGREQGNHSDVIIFLLPLIAWHFWGLFMYPSLTTSRIGTPLGAGLFLVSYVGAFEHFTGRFPRFSFRISPWGLPLSTTTMKATLVILVLFLSSSLAFISVSTIEDEDFRVSSWIVENTEEGAGVVVSTGMYKVLEYTGFTRIESYEDSLEILYPYSPEAPRAQIIERFRNWGYNQYNNFTLDFLLISEKFPFKFLATRDLKFHEFVEFLVECYSFPVVYNSSSHIVFEIR